MTVISRMTMRLASAPILYSGFRIRRVIHSGVTKTSMLCRRNTCSRAERGWVKPVGFDTGVTAYNSLTKQKEPLILSQEKIATW